MILRTLAESNGNHVMINLYFARVGQAERPVLLAKNKSIIAEYGINEWILTERGRKIGLIPIDMLGISGPGLLHEGEMAISIRMR